MATYRHFITLAKVLDEERWLDNIVLNSDTLIQNGVSEMIFQYEDVQIAFLSDNPFLRLESNLEGFNRGTINAIELRSGDGLEVYERISGLTLDALEFSKALPKGGEAVAADGLAHEIRTDGIEVDDHYGNATVWDGFTYQGAARYGVVLDQSNPIDIMGSFRLDEIVDYQFLTDGSSNPNGVFVDLNNLSNGNNLATLEAARQGVASFYSETGGPTSTVHSLTGINDASGSDGADKLIGRTWYEGPSGFDPDDNLIEGVDGSELHGNDGNDILLNGMLTYGGDGDDLIAVAAEGTFSDQSVLSGQFNDIDSLVIDGAKAYGGKGDDTFVVPNFGLGGGTLMFFDGGAGSDTLTFSAAGVDIMYAFDRAFQPTSFIDLGQNGPGLVNLEEATTGPLGNTKVITVQGIENVIGSIGADDIRGSVVDNHLRGGAGNDSIIGGSGNDIIEGGAGIDNLDGQVDLDMVSYESSDAAVFVDLRTQTATGGHAGTAGTAGVERDSLANFESVRGTEFADHLIGTNEANVLEGLGNNDRLEGLGGNDIIRSGDATFGSQPINALVLPVNPINESSGSAIDLTDRMTLTLIGGNPNFTQNGEPVTSVIGQGDGTGAHFYKITVDENTTKLTFNTVAQQGTTSFGAVLKMQVTRPNGTVDDALGSFGLVQVYSNTGIALDAGEYLIRIFNDGDPEIPVSGRYEFIIRAEGFPIEEVRGTDILDGGDGDDQLYAGDGDDELIGGQGDDVLNGRSGADDMRGGFGDDTYIVDSQPDMVTELAGQGSDLVRAATSYTLGDHVENGELLGTIAYNLVGNGLNNALTGNSASNIMLGGGGNDTVNGRGGADDMRGGTGNDNYVVDNTGDTVTETAGGGTDLVRTAVSYSLSDNVENGLMLGAADIFLAGNSGANTLVGNDGANTLNGRAGADRMFGNGGNDSYVIDNVGDLVGEVAGNGIDTVLTAVSRGVLEANVERLTMIGTGNINGSGNTLGNVILGNSGNNVINGREGNDTILAGLGLDTLYGSTGKDTFVYNSTAESGPLGNQRDRIADFTEGDLVYLAAIDADETTAGNQAFVLDTGGAFTAGEIKQTQFGSNLLLEMNTDADAAAEMSILLLDTGALDTGDFVL